MYVCELRTGWQLRHEPLYYDKGYYPIVRDCGDGWLAVAALPCPVQVPLIEAGIIGDPVIADNCLASAWIEDRSWWFKKTFTVTPAFLHSQNSELVAEGLDVEADLFLNDTYLGHQRSAMYPFRKDVRDILREGENVLIIRVTSGLEYVNELDVSMIKSHISAEYKRGRGPRGDNRRVLLRKPQYVYGWDWNPRIASCGIMGDVRIEAYDAIAIRHAKFTTKQLGEDRAQISVEAEIDNLSPIVTLDADVALDIRFDGAPVYSAAQDVFLISGINFVTFDLSIDHPRLWWPNGMGQQDTYEVTVSAETAGHDAEHCRFHAGIRTVRLKTERAGEGSRLFAFEINGVRTFCKGGNWETPDSVYGRVSDEKYAKLVEEAAAANFTMFRMNGVNAYERDYFYECCDRHGILLWQDFCFSCAPYRDDLDWFRQEVEQEVEYHTRRLANHPSVALWCGNNECQITMVITGEQSYWAGDKKPASPGGTVLYNDVMPRVVRRNTPEIPYWNSSPYGGGGTLNGFEYGDSHCWDNFMNDEMERRIIPEAYDGLPSKFISEFGCVGPSRKSSVVKYFGSADVDMHSAIWRMHTNTFEKDTMKAAIAKHYVEPEGLSLDEYLLYAGLFQGVMLGYAFESMRCAPDNYGALMWSYNDCWGEVGWSIVDYYATRKIAYYFVKRALAHQKLIMRAAGGMIDIICANDTGERLDCDLEYGYMTFPGVRKDTVVAAVTVEPFTKATVVARMKQGGHDTRRGMYYARTATPSGIVPATLRTADFRDLLLESPTFSVALTDTSRGNASFTVVSDTYAHAVHFGFGDDVRLSDEYFDLLPGEAREVTVSGLSIPLSAADIRAQSV